MGGNDLKKAYKLYRRKKYTQILQLLESQIFRYRQSFQFYYLLGMSCLYTGDFSGAESYLQRALSLKPGNKNALLGIAAVHLKQQKTSEALKDWFEVIDQDPKNSQANRGLAVVRKHADPDDLIAYTDSGRLYKLLPRETHIGPGTIALLIASALFVVGLLFYPLYAPYVDQMFAQKIQRPEIAKLDLTVDNYTSDQAETTADETENDDQPVTQFELSRKELRNSYEDVVQYFNRYEDNLAQREINRILLSNASKELKNKVSTLSTYTRTPSFDTLNHNFTYKEVRSQPLLYNDCYVIWKGRVSNLQVGENSIRFDLLVGYETEKVLDGIVPVQLDFAAHIDPAFPIEVLGRIESEEGNLRLKAASIHQFIPEEE
ncbi:MAG: tetratricopeptide repeat protein [Spirochaetota bacterium]